MFLQIQSDILYMENSFSPHWEYKCKEYIDLRLNYVHKPQPSQSVLTLQYQASDI